MTGKFMKTIKQMTKEFTEQILQDPKIFKKSYNKKMGGTQTIVIEGGGRFEYDDRKYYGGRGAKYNNASMHDNIGEVVVTMDMIATTAKKWAKYHYAHQKELMTRRSEERKRYNDAVALIGKKAVDNAIKLVRKFEAKTYYFVGNVMFFKAYRSDNVSLEIVSDDRRGEFVWEEWFAAPFAESLGMTAENKDLFIC